MSPSVKQPRSPLPSDPIGVFDSGVGGLSILQHLRRQLPRERFVFLADQAHVPYGGQSARQLQLLAGRITRFLLERHVKMVVVACNTSTCYSIDWLRRRFTIPFVGTVPAIKPACQRSVAKRVALMSTPATARSAFVRNLVREFDNGCTVTRIGCAGLEEAVESGSLDGPETSALLERYLARVRVSGADQLVLGCTHYPFLRSRIRSRHAIAMVDSGAAIARRTASLLTEHGIARARGFGHASFWTTGSPAAFSRVATALLGHPVRSRQANI